MLLPALLGQIFFLSRRQSQSDPEKVHPKRERDSDATRTQDAAEPSAAASRRAESARRGEDGEAEENAPYLTIDDERDENEIIRDLEEEEYPSRPRQRRRRRPSAGRSSHFSSFSSFRAGGAQRSVKLTSWWDRLKAFLNPPTAELDSEDYLPQYRYLPILSGIVIPFSILLEIPGLTEHWYIKTENNIIIDIKPNPPILDAGLAISMTCAIIANICLIVRFLEKRVQLMTICCVFFLTIHDILNIIIVTTFGVKHRFNDGFTYGQAFWMTVCSTSVSTLVNVTLLFDIFKTRDFAKSGSGLTRKQRSLVIGVIVLLCYIGFGALIQVYLIKLTFLNALYFTVVTVETIGFGDIVPVTPAARVFTCIYAVFGVVNLGLIVGLTRETAIEGIEVGYRMRVKAARKRRQATQWERRVANRWVSAIEWRLRNADQPIWVQDSDFEQHKHGTIIKFLERIWPFTGLFRTRSRGSGIHWHEPHGMHLNMEALTWPELEAAAMEAGVPLRDLLPCNFRKSESGKRSHEKRRESDASESEKGANNALPGTLPEPNDLPLTHRRLGRMVVMLANFAFAVNESSFTAYAHAARTPKEERDDETVDGHLHENRTVMEQYDSLREGMREEERKAFYFRFVSVWTVFLIFWMVGSAIFTATEGWTFGVATYFCFVSFMTIGYGDYTPKTQAGRAIFIFWALLGVGTMTILISILTDAYSSRYKNIFLSSKLIQAIRRYRESVVSSRASQRDQKRARGHADEHILSLEQPLSAQTIDSALSDSQQRTAERLEALPHEVLRRARTFNENVKYLIEPPANVWHEPLPPGLVRLLNDVAGVERISEQIKGEILRDKEARHRLLALSIENALLQLIDIAEDALDSLRERNRLAQLLGTEVDAQTSESKEE